MEVLLRQSPERLTHDRITLDFDLATITKDQNRGNSLFQEVARGRTGLGACRATAALHGVAELLALAAPDTRVRSPGLSWMVGSRAE